MNRTTVKRGIGAVILALIAAALLAFLLKDKAAQRQEVVEIALPGTDGSIETNNSVRLPTLTTDNSGNGSVIANAGSGSGTGAENTTSVSTGINTGTQTASAGNGNTTSSTNSAGTIIASAAAVGTAAAGAAAVAGTTAGTTVKTMDFSVKPKVSKASSEFLDLDLVNNGTSRASDSGASASKAVAAVAASTAAAVPAQAAPQSNTDTNQGIVIASTAPRTSGAAANVVQPRLIGEKRSAPVKSASTAKVVTKPVKTSSANAEKENPSVAKQAKNGYAIQLLATSSSARANNLKKVMSGEGYSTYVTKTKQNGKTLYRVRIGQYANKSQAAKVQSAMKRRYKKNTNVNRSAIVAR